jgi:Fe-S cluster biosynthesis and repair protein YggX
MTRTVHCVKLGTTAEGLVLPPFPGPLGERIFKEISKAAWQQWLGHQTMLINEYRLNLLEPEAKKFLEKEMKRFLFAEEV